MESTPARTPSPRVVGLDVLRGLAISMVLVRHGWAAFGGAGAAGVTVFFALSGYLMTGVISRMIGARGRMNYRVFYRNRVVRLVPALAVMLAGYVIVESSSGSTPLALTLITVLVGATYVMDLLPTVHLAPGLTHLWTLAVEEQFYLLWPLFLTTIERGRRTPRRWVLGAAFVAWLIAILTTMISAKAATVTQAYTLPTSWAVTLLIGASAWVHRGRLARLCPRTTVAAASVSLVVIAVVSVQPEVKGSAITYIVISPVIAIGAVALINLVVRWPSVPRLLVPLRAMGLISYAAYLWNYPICHWVGDDFGNAAGWRAALSVVLTVGAATVSYYLVEKPISRRFRLDPHVAHAGAAVATLHSPSPVTS